MEKPNTDPQAPETISPTTPSPFTEKVLSDEQEAMEAVRWQQAEQESKAVPTSAELEDQTHQEFRQLNSEQKRWWALGIAGLGFKVQELKGALLSGLYGKLAEGRWEKGKSEAEQGALARFYTSLKDSYTETSERAAKDLNGYRQGTGAFMGRQIRAGKGIGFLLGNAAWYGRALVGYAGETLGNPARLVTIGAMALGKMSEGMKEARLRGAESIEAARIGKKEAEVREQTGEMFAPQTIKAAYQADIETATEQAWAIYEKARNGGREITKADLEKAYRKQLPQNILDRLAETQFSKDFYAHKNWWRKLPSYIKIMNPPEFSNALFYAASLFTGELTITLAEQHLKSKVQVIQDKLDAIERSPLPNEEKNKQKEAMLNRYASFLKDVDRMVGEAGAVDLIAFGSGVLEKLGKGVAVGMAVETLAEGVPRLWSAWQAFTSDIAPKVSEMLFGTTEEPVSFKHAPSGKIAPQNFDKVAEDITQATERERVMFSDESKVSPDILKAATIGKGESIEHAFIRQIKLRPDWFGYKGDVSDAKTMEQFANTKAHQLAIEYGYVKTEGDLITEETRVRQSGGSYILEPDGKGGVKDLHVAGRSEYIYKEDEEIIKRLLAEEEQAELNRSTEALKPVEAAQEYSDARTQELQSLLVPELNHEVPASSYYRGLPAEEQAATEAVVSSKPVNPLLENIVGSINQTPEMRAAYLAAELQKRTLSAEDFLQYYTKRVAGGASARKNLLQQLQETITKANSGTAQERGMAQRALTVIAQRLMKEIAAAKK